MVTTYHFVLCLFSATKLVTGTAAMGSSNDFVSKVECLDKVTVHLDNKVIADFLSAGTTFQAYVDDAKTCASPEIPLDQNIAHESLFILHFPNIGCGLLRSYLVDDWEVFKTIIKISSTKGMLPVGLNATVMCAYNKNMAESVPQSREGKTLVTEVIKKPRSVPAARLLIYNKDAPGKVIDRVAPGQQVELHFALTDASIFENILPYRCSLFNADPTSESDVFVKEIVVLNRHCPLWLASFQETRNGSRLFVKIPRRMSRRSGFTDEVIVKCVIRLCRRQSSYLCESTFYKCNDTSTTPTEISIYELENASELELHFETLTARLIFSEEPYPRDPGGAVCFSLVPFCVLFGLLLLSLFVTMSTTFVLAFTTREVSAVTEASQSINNSKWTA